jgi:quercetin dioxygenase-like cupin family protein
MRSIVFSTGLRYAALLLLVTDLAGGAPPLHAQAQAAPGSKSPEQLIHVNEHDIPWSDDRAHSSSMRWRTLLGTGGYFGEGLPNQDLYFRQGEMEPGAVYAEHSHPSPEAWFFISGRAKWKVDGETFIAEPGSAVYLKPNAVSSLEIISKEKADIVRINWGISCDRNVLTHKKYIFLGDKELPQTPRSRLPRWDYAADTTRHPISGDSNLDTPQAATSTVQLKVLNYHDVRWPEPYVSKTGVIFPWHWITLVGDAGGGWGRGLPNEDILFGVGESGSTGIYDSHKHDVPEFYYVISGRIDFTVDGQQFTAEPGELVYLKPWAVHRLVTVSKATAVSLWADWGVNCDRSVLRAPYKSPATAQK